MPTSARRATPKPDGRATPKPGDRSAHFPAIEKKHGKPVSHWLKLIADLGDATYPQQIALLRERHEFSQTHANALVMYARGSTTSKRFATPAQYFASLDPAKARTVRAILRAIRSKHPKLELVMAWNQPMLRSGDKYVFGVSVATNHVVIAPFDATLLASLSTRLAGYQVNKKTVRVPIGWKVDASLLDAMIRPQLSPGGVAREAAQSKKNSKKSAKASRK